MSIINSLKENLKNVSWPYVAIPAALSLMGLIFIFSTGINPDGSNTGQYLRQILWIAIGIIIAIMVINIDYFRLVETSAVYYIIGIALLIVSFIFGKNIRGHKSWLGIGGFGIQFSEIMKVFYILYFAKYLSNAPIAEKKTRVFLISLLILIAPLMFILLQPDYGTTLVYLSIFLCMSYLGMQEDRYVKYMLIIAGASLLVLFSVGYYKYYITNGGHVIEFFEIIFSFNTFLIIAVSMFLYSSIAVIIDFFQPVKIIRRLLPFTLIIGISSLVSALALKVFKGYMWNRILVMFNPEFDRNAAGYNIIQSKIAVGSGGFFGKGIFQGTQNVLGFLPEKNTDFIFSVIAEESGFIGSVFILILYTAYFYLIINTIQNSKDKEGMLVATGVLALFFSHVLINLGMTLGITPATGVPLPFISYGGSSFIGFISAAALLLNVHSRRFVH